jgi:hypothetical protein
MGITTHGESVQHLQSVKLVYQPCSQSYGTDDINDNYVYAIYYSCLSDHVFIWVYDKLVATQLLKIVTQ